VTSIEPGWYKDPAEPTTQRYWDGEGWLGKPIPADAVPPEIPPSPEPEPTAGPLGQLGPLGPLGPAGGPLGPDLVPGQPVPGQSVPGQGPPAGAQWQPQPGGPPPGVPQAPPGAPWPATWQGNQQAALRYAMAARLLPAPRPHGYALAPISARFMARMIDILAVLGLNVVVNGWFVVQYVRELSPIVSEVQRRMRTGEPLTSVTLPSRLSWLELAILGVAMALWFAYEVPANAGNGQTLGKRLMRIKVMRFDAPEPLGIGRAWRRWNPLGLAVLLWGCWGVGFLLQSADLLIGVIDRPLHQAMHDRAAGTVVVRLDGIPLTSPSGHGLSGTPQSGSGPTGSGPINPGPTNPGPTNPGPTNPGPNGTNEETR
jgi:RDD family/Protein of unknown function (DUF2510)